VVVEVVQLEHLGPGVLEVLALLVLVVAEVEVASPEAQVA
jgi:hypothetical protein